MAKNIAFVPTQPYKKVYGAGTPEKPQYMPTYYEWLRKNSERITINYTSTGGNATIYTIPSNFTLFLTNLTMNWAYNSSGAAVNFATFMVYLSQTSIPLGSLVFDSQISGGTTKDVQNLSKSYPIPFEIPQNIAILETSTASVATFDNQITTILEGFLVSNSKIPSNF